MSNARVSGCGCGCGCQGGCSYSSARGGPSGPSHYTTLADQVVGLACGCGCNNPSCAGNCGSVCPSCASRTAVSGAQTRGETRSYQAPAAGGLWQKPSFASAPHQPEPEAKVSGCKPCEAKARAAAERMKAEGARLGAFQNADGIWMYRFYDANGELHEGQIVGGTQDNPSLYNVRRIS